MKFYFLSRGIFFFSMCVIFYCLDAIAMRCEDALIIVGKNGDKFYRASDGRLIQDKPGVGAMPVDPNVESKVLRDSVQAEHNLPSNSVVVIADQLTTALSLPKDAKAGEYTKLMAKNKLEPAEVKGELFDVLSESPDGKVGVVFIDRKQKPPRAVAGVLINRLGHLMVSCPDGVFSVEEFSSPSSLTPRAILIPSKKDPKLRSTEYALSALKRLVSAAEAAPPLERTEWYDYAHYWSDISRTDLNSFRNNLRRPENKTHSSPVLVRFPNNNQLDIRRTPNFTVGTLSLVGTDQLELKTEHGTFTGAQLEALIIGGDVKEAPMKYGISKEQ